MKTLIDQLSQYADYHRDPRNIATHCVGVPMILLAVVVLLSRPAWPLVGSGVDALTNGVALTPSLSLSWWQTLPLSLSAAVIAALAVTIFYLRLDLRYGLVMGFVLLVMLGVGQWLAQQETNTWLIVGIGLFVVGWVIQFIGHYYEGRKPAFVDDVVGLLIGPLFVLAEMGFALGWRKSVQQAVEQRSGPVRRRSLTGSPRSSQ